MHDAPYRNRITVRASPGLHVLVSLPSPGVRSSNGSHVDASGIVLRARGRPRGAGVLPPGRVLPACRPHARDSRPHWRCCCARRHARSREGARRARCARSFPCRHRSSSAASSPLLTGASPSSSLESRQARHSSSRRSSPGAWRRLRLTCRSRPTCASARASSSPATSAPRR